MIASKKGSFFCRRIKGSKTQSTPKFEIHQAPKFKPKRSDIQISPLTLQEKPFKSISFKKSDIFEVIYENESSEILSDCKSCNCDNEESSENINSFELIDENENSKININNLLKIRKEMIKDNKCLLNLKKSKEYENILNSDNIFIEKKGEEDRNEDKDFFLFNTQRSLSAKEKSIKIFNNKNK